MLGGPHRLKSRLHKGDPKISIRDPILPCIVRLKWDELAINLFEVGFDRTP